MFQQKYLHTVRDSPDTTKGPSTNHKWRVQKWRYSMNISISHIPLPRSLTDQNSRPGSWMTDPLQPFQWMEETPCKRSKHVLIYSYRYIYKYTYFLQGFPVKDRGSDRVPVFLNEGWIYRGTVGTYLVSEFYSYCCHRRIFSILLIYSTKCIW